MDETYIRKGKAAGINPDPAITAPKDIEYEQLNRDLRKSNKKVVDMRGIKNNPIDLIDNSSTIEKLDKSTIILVPGMLVNYENGQHDTPPYPQDGMFNPNGGLLWE